MDDENIAVVKDADAHTPEEILQAAQVCPVDAIKLTDADTGEQVWPEG
jgi:ferredoxin